MNVRGIATAGMYAIVMALACDPNARPERGLGGPQEPPLVPLKPTDPSPPKMQLAEASPGAPTIADSWDLVAAGVLESVHGISLETFEDGPWQVRRRMIEPAQNDGESRSDTGFGGLGLVGPGRGGGGGGGGLGSLGTIGTLGHGSGTGKGSSSYGRGSPREPAPKAAPPSRTRQNIPLRAGSTDDNADLKRFIADTDRARKSLGDRFEEIDVRERTLVRIVDRDGAPIPGATLRLVNRHQREFWRATTYGDGRAPIYPGIVLRDHSQDDLGELELVVQASGTQLRVPWPGSRDEFTISLPITRKLGPVVVEVLFVIDTTGSMGEEIAQIKATLVAVTDKLHRLDEQAELRYGAVLYRDLYDTYVTMSHPFTDDIQAFDNALRRIQAKGGGDFPESVNQALARTVQGIKWRPDSAKIAFLIGDAPPHMDYKGEATYGESARLALAKGIRIHAVAAGGLDPLGSVVFRQIAQLTRGKFIFIEYGKDLAGSAAKHGVRATKLKGNNLDTIIYAQIRDEIRGFGVR